ncbi:tRNA (34-2'-O)-methyltransferase regulator WDR6 isoform X2 [Osmia lignaria lignaria]
MGCTLHVFGTDTYKLEKKINCLYPHSIHGIIEGPNDMLAVFGANFLCAYNIQKNQGTLIIEEVFSNKCFDDWIIAAKWLTSDGYDYLSVLLAHNSVCIYDSSKERSQNVWCKEKCILYGGSMFVKNQKDLVIFSGTVYREILIWEINYSYSCIEISPVLHRLHGHNGVIFSVIYDPVTRLICSTSDDRTVRLWEVNSNESKENDIIWKEVKIKLRKTMFGHTARVWKSVIRNDALITIGEDSHMCTWSLDGKLLKKICAHHGAAIWSIDISNDNNWIFTGGADGAVHAWPFFTNDYVEPVVLLSRQDTFGLPKYNCYLSSGNSLIFNENGTVCIYDRWHGKPKETVYLERCNTYCVMEVSLCHSYVCFASKDGYITIYKEADVTTKKILQLIAEDKIMESKIFSVQWLRNDELVASGSNGILKIFSFTMEGSVTILSICLLPQSRERWLTAAILCKELLVCGDRSGNMHVFELEKYTSDDRININEMRKKPLQTFHKVHGNIGIQNLVVLHSKLISGGRDGMLRFYDVIEHKNKRSLCPLHSEKMPMDWISGSLKVSNDLFILGFKETEFVIYSMFYRRIVARVPCGGGHRSWDCIVLNELVSFLYIRNKEVYIFDFPLNALKSPDLLNGFHTKEVNFMEPVLKSNTHNLFISGGEDGTVRVSCVSTASMENICCLETLGIFDGHISSVKFIGSLCLETSDFSCSNHLVFSGGGRAQLKVWEIGINNRKKCLQSTDVSCRDVTSHMLYGFDRCRKKRWQDSNRSYILQPETRYMDGRIYRDTTNLHCILLFVACADGFTRIFLYDTNTRNISLKIHAKCASRCIVKITILKYEEKVIALTMSTDGIVRFIDFTEIVSNIVKEPNCEKEEFFNYTDVSIGKFNLHQSGINSYDIKMIGNKKYCLATGGDDNLFNVIHFKIWISSENEQLRVSLLSKWNTSTAHGAQITGIKFHKDKIFTVGIDQQIIVYSYNYNDDFLSVTILKKIFTCVTDVKGLTLWYNSKDEAILCVYGKGFEILAHE